ncbi:MAG: TolC family protein [Desulfobacteraceae bacterium]|nr:TolC family protein [Desulfobacteraceae bacterium]
MGVHQLYYGLLIAEKQKDAAMAALNAAQEVLHESEDAVRSGNVLDNAAIGSRARLLQNRQYLLAAENQIADLTSELGDLLNLPQDTELLITGIADTLPELQTPEQYLGEGLSRNPEIQAAKDLLEKAHHGVRAAQDEYIPDISLFARHTYQDGVPFITRHIETYGVQMTWNIFDGGNRRSVLNQRRSQLSQAEENLKRTENRIAVEIGKAYRKVERSGLLTDAARESLSYQRENLRLSGNQLKAGVTSDARHAESVAAVRKAELEELQAHLGYRLALAELDRMTGRFNL